MKKGLRYLVVSVLLLGVFALNVSAAEENGCPGHGGAIAVGASQTLDTPNATYYLTNDITGVTKRISDGSAYYDGFNVTADNVTLCMNGYSIIPTQSAAAVRVANKMTGFKLCNCQADRGGVVTGKGDNRSMLLMPDSKGAIYKGVHLDNNTTVTRSPAVQVNGNASFSMFGGSINNNGSTSNGANLGGATGALVGLGDSTINLIGGEILNNDLTTASGATMIGSVVSNGGTVTMQEGFVISGNRFTNSYDAKSAGGVYVTNGTFTMNGGTITESTDNCGGVYVTSGLSP